MTKRKNLKILWVSFLLSAFFVSTDSLSGQSVNNAGGLRKFNSAMQIINYSYVEKVDEEMLIEKAIIAALRELDPHSRYVPKDELSEANEPLEGCYQGIGVTYHIFRDTILVISAHPGGPSDIAGIRSGDKIVRIDDEDATGERANSDFAMNRLRGKSGTEVTIQVVRKGIREPVGFTIVRGEIPINSVDASYMASKTTGYIRINRFSMTTMGEFRHAVASLRKEGMENLILDLRNNSGGYLNVAVDLADEFLESGKLIVYTEGESSPRKKYHSTFAGTFEDGRLVILIDEGSASASEIVSGAIQDWDRGLIIGRRSFGKGLVQRPYYLPDSSMIRLTIARYYTPSGRCIQKPYAEGFQKYQNDIEERISHGEMAHPDSIRMPDSLKYLTCKQRTVYGGGGILPDIFVPYDSLRHSEPFTGLIGKGLFTEFILDYLEVNRELLLKKYSSPSKFVLKFSDEDDVYDRFLVFLDGKDDPSLLTADKALTVLVKTRLKAVLGMNLWDYGAYVQIMNQIDKTFLEAVETLSNDSYTSILAGN